MIGSRGEYGRPKRLRLRPTGISRAVVYFGIHRDAGTGNRSIVLRTTVDVTHMGPATNADLGNERRRGRERRNERRAKTTNAGCLLFDESVPVRRSGGPPVVSPGAIFV